MHKQKGFTIVELIVVIVVIAILAAITLVGYSMVQKRANDTRRINDITTLQKAIEIYASENGSFPKQSSGPSTSSWATSNNYPNDFVDGLTGSSAGMSALPELPLDPINNTQYYYRYHVYTSATGCDTNRSPFYVLQIVRMESGYGPSTDASNKSPDSPGWNCGPGNRNWETEAAYTVGGYLH